MYNMNMYYDISSFVMLIIRFAASSVLCLNYTRYFLKEKNGKKATLLVWTTIYVLGATVIYFAFNTVNVFQNILCTAVRIVFLLILQRLFFHNCGPINLFIVFSFLAGRELTVSIIAVMTYQSMGDVSMGILNSIAESAEMGSEAFLIEHGMMVLFVLDIIITAAAVAGYAVILGLYLKILKKSFRKKDHRLQRRESVFLILPLVASICISITVRIMEFSERGEYSDIFEVVPITKLFIPLVDILLLGTNIAAVILFQSMLEYNEEKNKRDLLESQISQMRGEITEIQDIYSDIRGLRHDMKNHIENISLYLKRSGAEDERLSEYIGGMSQTVDRLDFSFNTGDPICDVIIHRKKGEAEKAGISFKSDFTFPETDSLDSYDVGVILSNSLENAIEACEKVKMLKEFKGVKEAYVFLRSYVKGSLFFIEIENSFSGAIKLCENSGLPLTSKEGATHGFGLSNIERTAKKYMGDIDVSTEEIGGKGVFFLTVMLHM